MCPENNWGRRIGLAALITDDQIDRIFSIYMNGFTTNADLRNAAREIIRTSIQPALAAPAPQVPSEVARCMCKDRALTDCPGEWEPGCDLGNNAEHVRVSTTDPAVIDAAVAAPAARLVGGEADELRTVMRSLGYSDTAINAMGDSTTMMQRAVDAARALARAQAAPADAPGEQSRA